MGGDPLPIGSPKPSRRAFLISATLASSSRSASQSFESKRPPVSQRAFTSEAVEATIETVKRDIADPELAWLFETCFPNTLDTTVRYREVQGQPDTFVITGDINAMWLRDSSAQVWPYLPLVKQDAHLKSMLAGVIRRQTKCMFRANLRLSAAHSCESGASSHSGGGGLASCILLEPWAR